MEFSMELFWAVVVIATIVAEMLTVGLVDSAEVLSYLRSESMEALTPIWKV